MQSDIARIYDTGVGEGWEGVPGSGKKGEWEGAEKGSGAEEEEPRPIINCGSHCHVEIAGNPMGIGESPWFAEHVRACACTNECLHTTVSSPILPT